MTKKCIVEGFRWTSTKAQRVPLVVRVTVDKRGKSLSISDDETIMLHIPLEPLSGLIKINEYTWEV